MVLSASESGVQVAPWGQERLRKNFAERFAASHMDRTLGFGAPEGSCRLESASGLRLGWVLRGEGTAKLRDGMKALLPGDQIALSPDRPLEVEGSFAWAWIAFSRISRASR